MTHSLSSKRRQDAKSDSNALIAIACGVGRHIATAVTFLGILVVFLTVKQIRHVFPAADSSLLFHGYTWGLGAVYFAVLAWVVTGWRQPQLTDCIARHASWPFAILFFLTGIAFVAVSVSSTEGLRDGYLLDGAVLPSFALLALIWAGWIALTRARFCESGWNLLPSSVTDVLLRALLAVTVLTVAGEVMWCVSLVAEFASPRAYTVGALCHVALLILCVAAVLDAWTNEHGRLAWIASGLALGAAVIWGLHAPNVGQQKVLPVSQATADFRIGPAERPAGPAQTSVDASSHPETWLGRFLQRMASSDSSANDPVILVAASGGGSRAALFTALIYEDLQNDPIALEEGSPDGTDVYAANQHIALISSVSGGTLASACYVSPEYTAGRLNSQGVRAKPRHSDPFDVLRLMESEALALSKSERFRRIHPPEIVEAVWKDCDRRWQARELWPFQQRAFIDDMCTDFMAPLLRGALYLGIERGTSVASYWQRHFDLFASNLRPPTAGQGTAGKPQFPLLLCNATDVSGGGAIVIGFPEVDRGVLASSSDSAGTPAGLPVRGLLDLKPGFGVELRLSECVRLSANFPWGFQVASVDIEPANPVSSDDLRRLHLIDGGVFDNTGITTVRWLISRLEELAKPEGTLMAVQARLVLEELKRRGVILLEIDSGAKQEAPGFVSRLFSGVLEPVTALTNATYGTAGYLRERNVAALKTALQNSTALDLRDRLRGLVRRTEGPVQSDLQLQLAGSIDVLYHVVVICNEEENVMTAWALGPDDKAKIFVRYLVARQELRRRLREVILTHRSVKSHLEDLEPIVRTMEAQLDGGRPPSFTDEVKPAVDLFSDLIKIRDALQIDTEIEQRLNALYATQAPVAQIDSVAEKKREFIERRARVETLPMSRMMQQNTPIDFSATLADSAAWESPAMATPPGESDRPLEYAKVKGAMDRGLRNLDNKFEVLKGRHAVYAAEAAAAEPPP